MKILGGGITGDLAFKILSGFKPATKPALKWKQLANGSYIVIDRKEDCDIYECAVSLHGREEDINEFVRAIEDNRRSSSNANIFNLSDFNESEKIFGAEIDYSSPIKAMVTKMGEVEQKSWLGFSLKVTFRALGKLPTMAGVDSIFPNVNKCHGPPDATRAFVNVGFTAETETDIQKSDTYAGTPVIADLRGDSGFFEGTFIMRTHDMANLRKFLLCTRGDVIRYDTNAGAKINSISGVHHLFGARCKTSMGSLSVRIKEWADMGMKDLDHWQIKIKFIEEQG